MQCKENYSYIAGTGREDIRTLNGHFLCFYDLEITAPLQSRASIKVSDTMHSDS